MLTTMINRSWYYLPIALDLRATRGRFWRRVYLRISSGGIGDLVRARS
jgi:hypothetical protein